jgi:dUTP pyrophosphatase
MDRLPIRIFRVRGARDADLPLPAPATPESAGMDLRAAVPDELLIAPGERVLVPTGFAVAIPPGFEGQVRPRSGLALRHGVGIPNAPGTIDADYRGEVAVLLQNGGAEPFRLRRGERIAQLVIAPIAVAQLEEVQSSSDLGETERGPNGFGHTGR